jgi:hypothetical protein
LGVENFQKLITFLNDIQFSCLKGLFYSPWKDLSNTTLIAAIKVDLTSEIAKNVKPNNQL